MRKTASSPFLYIGIETKDREFEAKLLLAASAAEKGMIVFLGQHVLLNRAIAGLMPGIFLVKGLNRVQIDALRHGGDRHLVAAISEESLGLSDPGAMMKEHDRDASQFCDLVFAQGEVDAWTFVNHLGFEQDQVLSTGNPRLDLLRSPLSSLIEPEAEKLRQRFGRFILVNTNCSGVHPAFGTTDDFFKLCVDVGFLDPDDEAEVADWWTYIEHDKRNDRALAASVDALSARLPDHTVIVRPHPSEDFTVWADRFKGRDRIHVVREGSHLPWMVVADALVHANCTSGVEAEVLGRPVVSIALPESPILHWFLSNEVNRLAHSPDEVADIVAAMVEEGPAAGDTSARQAEREAAIERHLTIATDGYAFDRIADALADRVADKRHLAGRVSVRPFSFQDSAERHPFAKSKFSLGLEEINDRLSGFAGLLDRFHGVEINEAWESLFILSKRGRLLLPDDGPVFRHIGS